MESPRNCLWWLGVDLLETVMETIVKGFRHGAGTLDFSKAKKSFTMHKWRKWWKVMTECRFRGRGKGMCFRGTGQERFPYPCLCPCCLSLGSTWMWASTFSGSYRCCFPSADTQSHGSPGGAQSPAGENPLCECFQDLTCNESHVLFLAPNHVPNPRKSPVQWTSLFPSASIQHFA